MGYVKGDSIRFYNQGVAITKEVDVTLNVNVDTIETTDKDSAGWKTFEDGDKSWTCSVNANLDWAAAENLSQVFADVIAGDAVAIDVGSSTDSKFYSGTGIFTSLSVEGPRNGLGTFSCEIQGTAALAEGTTT